MDDPKIPSKHSEENRSELTFRDNSGPVEVVKPDGTRVVTNNTVKPGEHRRATR